MTEVKRTYVHLTTVFLILIFCRWGRLAESNDVSSSTETQERRIGDVKLTYSKPEASITELEKELFPLSKISRNELAQETSQPVMRAKVAKKKVILSGEQMNTSVDIECAGTKQVSVNDKAVLHNMKSHENTDYHFKEKRLDRQKRDSQSTRSSSATPEGSTEGKPEGSPEGSSAEPQTEPTAAPERSWPEPEPDWDEAYTRWQDAWPIHTYGFAVVFTVITMIPPFELLRIHLDKARISPLKSTVLVIIFTFSLTRAITLFVDPYGSANRFPLVVTQLLFSLGHPCIISALSLLLLVLIDTTKMNIAPPRFQRVQFIIPVVIFHVILVIVTDFVVVYFLEAKVLLLMCQIYFLLLGSLLAIGYMSVGWKIHKNIRANVNTKITGDNSMRRLLYLIIACAVASALISILTIYAAAGVFGVYSDVEHVEAWPWWIFQTLNRLLETTICIVVLLMNTKTTKRKILPSFVTVSVFNSRRKTNDNKIAPAKIYDCQSIQSVE